MIEFHDVRKVFSAAPLQRERNAVTALDGLDLRLEGGAVHAVVGPNGAGKTTLFAVLLGFLFPTSGTATIAGFEPRRFVRRHGAAYLPERFRLPGEWSVRDALVGLARLEGLDRAAALSGASETIERMGLAEHAAKRLDTLSRGLLQRVGIAQTLLSERPLVVLDEPTEGLDPIWRVRFREVVRAMRSEDRVVLVASHDLGEVERLADSVVLLEGGRVREVLEPRAARQGAGRYVLQLVEPADIVGEAFPGATTVDETGAAYIVTVEDAAELSERIAALIAGGGRIVAVRPADEPLEERVRRSLRGGEGGTQ